MGDARRRKGDCIIGRRRQCLAAIKDGPQHEPLDFLAVSALGAPRILQAQSGLYGLVGIAGGQGAGGLRARKVPREPSTACGTTMCSHGAVSVLLGTDTSALARSVNAGWAAKNALIWCAPRFRGRTFRPPSGAGAAPALSNRPASGCRRFAAPARRASVATDWLLRAEQRLA